MIPVSSASSSRTRAAGAYVDAFGGRYYRIEHSDRLPAFLMNVVSPSDLWLFLASNGGLTAGRISAEHALFPYQTVDRIYDSAGSIGPFTAIRIGIGDDEVLWEPFAEHTPQVQSVHRNLYKSVEGDRVWFEEVNLELGLAFRYGWSTADDHGFIRRCELENLRDTPRALRLVDGLRHLLPPGIPARLQSDSSCLTDAYKTAELIPDSSLAVFSLAAAIVDRAIPMESLRACAVWSDGLPGADILLSDVQLPAFHAGERVTGETHRRGIRSTYAVSAVLTLPPRTTQRWLMVADTDLAQAEIVRRHQQLARGGLADAVLRAADEASARLRGLVGLADGLQVGGAEATTAHHFANTLFNLMRGGVFASGYATPARDFASFVRTRNHSVAERHAAFLASLPDGRSRPAFLEALARQDDRDLERLGFEYLPLTFSRRHGDPSRPWNRFNIRLRDAAGNRVLHHEGNWRDIFQNWEALCLSFPEYLESMAAKFVNASTLDGYNPYRLSHTGVDWEIPDHDDPWSSIGYWGDHQTIYLLKFLEWSGRFHPGRLARWLRRDLFTYAAVPYRIAPYEAMRQDPHVTIEFDAARHHEIEQLIGTFGTDARLVRHASGAVHHVNLTEKLLVLILTRLTNFVPGGGIWMNTQRPEWNDANNALVGYGVSMVTLCYVRRFLVHFQQQLLPALSSAPVVLSAAVVQLTRQVLAAFDQHRPILSSPEIPSTARRALLDALATAGSDYRATVYQSDRFEQAPLAPTELDHLCTLALAFVDHTIRANRRPDGHYHAYNLLEFTEQPAGLEIHPLAPMLEGQVAVLSAGVLRPAEVVALLHTLRHGELYRPDQHSYLLYPDRQIPGFLARNTIEAAAVASCPLLRDLIDARDERLILRDTAGQHRFHPDLVNGDALEERLQALARDPRWASAVASHAPLVKAIYERVFHHRAFTGRSGSMFGYEGLGCIYWHMVAKLLLAVQENLFAAEQAGDPHTAQLAAAYREIRAGLGFNKTPADYGAFPADPYSHTPGHSGAQQPGMTGQVKEEVLTRLGELGVHIEQGRLRFAPTFLEADEFASAPAVFVYVNAAGQEAKLTLPAGTLAFTFCGVPVIYRRSPEVPGLRIFFADGTTQAPADGSLGADLAAEVFARSGRVARIEVTLPG